MIEIGESLNLREMLRILSVSASRKYLHPQLQEKLLYSISRCNASTLTAPDIITSNPQNLPHLPVPKLASTFEKYVETVKPFLSNEELVRTSRIIEEFSKPEGTGAELQKYLERRAQEKLNWLEDWWLEVAYLSFREPVVIFSSPGQALPFQDFKDEESRLTYCSKLILAAASYKMLIDGKKIPIDKMGKEELDMNQYNKIFGTCRIPDIPADTLEFHGKSKHIVVVHKNHFYKVNIFNDQNLPISENQVLKQLHKIVTESSHQTYPVGVLTTENRDTWATAYKKLIADPLNRLSASEIQQSLFLVCLDSNIEKRKDENRQTYGSRLFIHGGGASNGNAGNRWYDKTVQFVVGDEGTVGLTYEHSPSEGQPIAVMVDYLDAFIKNHLSQNIPNAVNVNVDPVELPFKLGDDLKVAIETASENIDKLADNLDLEIFTFDTFGKEFIKSQKFSPDSFIQIALQYTFYRIHKVPGAHYESAATRKYIGGRTETIRSCSLEAISFAKAMLDTTVSGVHKYKMMSDAIQGHKKYSVEAVNGFGVDRHLLGLKLAAKDLNIELPDFYKDASYSRSVHMRISSSQVATKCDAYMCYAPLTDDGYGCCYNPRENTINFSLSAFVSNPITSAKNFRQNLEQSLLEMQSLSLKMKQSKL